MDDVYSCVEDTQIFQEKIQRLGNVVERITKQTIECSFFIRDYCSCGFGSKDVILRTLS